MVRYSARSHLPAEHDDQTVAIRQDLLLTSQWSDGEGESEEEKKRRGKERVTCEKERGVQGSGLIHSRGCMYVPIQRVFCIV